MILTKMKVGTRLSLGFALVLMLLVLVTALGIFRMSQIQQRLEQVVDVSNVQSRLVLDMRAIVYDRTFSGASTPPISDLTAAGQPGVWSVTFEAADLTADGLRVTVFTP